MDDLLETPPLPFLSASLPGVGGVLKTEPEDFVVEEIPAYLPSGTGDHLFLWVEKRDVSAELLTQHIANVCQIHRNDVGVAGLKDRRAITRQWISVPAEVEPRISGITTEGIELLDSARHENKLRTGHLKANRFEILIRDVVPDGLERAREIAPEVMERGFPNYYGDQRFGFNNDTLALGLKLLREESSPRDIPRPRRKFLLRLAISAVQSALFNQGLARRIADRNLHTIFPGEVMQVVASGGLFLVEDLETEQYRFDALEIVNTGPLFGPKMRKPSDEMLLEELALLKRFGLSLDQFRAFKKQAPGGRRPYLIHPDGFKLGERETGLKMEVTLPSGVYATMFLREFQKLA